jgi:(p)ppGpp synthase/HD superfamily hydrolase
MLPVPPRPPLSPRFDEALAYAIQLHRDQRRKGTDTPYAAHLLAVCALVMEDEAAGEDEMIAALLHDAVEDQGEKTSLAEIERRFGPAVAEIVAGCTDFTVPPRPPWRARKEAYLASIPCKPPHVRRVSTADALHNARSMLRDHRAIGEALWTRFKAGREGTLWYLRAAAEAFHAAGGGLLADELLRTVAALEEATGPPSR